MYHLHIILSLLSFTVAESLSPPCNCHTWHNVTAYKGKWTATVMAVDEPASFVHKDCSIIEPLEKLNVSKLISPQFGFKPGATDDFDISYVLTFIRTDPHKVVKESSTINATTIQRRLFSSMACVFVVAAAGPAMPDVRAEPYNGAVCMWNRVDGIGENYYLDFN